jgi:hypothetical protein
MILSAGLSAQPAKVFAGSGLGRRKRMQRRNFLRAILPVAAMVGSSVTVLGHEGVVREIRPDKRYVFQFPAGLSQEKTQQLAELLKRKGFKSPLVVSGVVNLYELDSQ